MSKKRSADESSSKEPTTEEVSDPVVFAKRAKLDTLTDTTIQDLPIEMLERILVRAVTMEVKDMKMAKRVWKEKADLVINRLQTVCSQWRNILMTSFFQKEVYRILDVTAQETIQLEILHELHFEFCVEAVTAMKDEIFILTRSNGQWNGQGYVINVYNRNDKDVEVKDVIPLKGIQYPYCMAPCSVSNCLYVLKEESQCSSVLRIARNEEHQFKISTWITDLRLSSPILSVSANGRLAIISSAPKPSLASTYNANGFLHHTLMLSEDTHRIEWIKSVVHRPNGSLVLAGSVVDYLAGRWETNLVEIDTRGNVLHLFKLYYIDDIEVTFADIYGRIWTIDDCDAIEVVDSKLNKLRFDPSQSRDKLSDCQLKLHFNIDRNEILRISRSWEGSYKSQTLTVFRITGK